MELKEVALSVPAVMLAIHFFLGVPKQLEHFWVPGALLLAAVILFLEEKKLKGC